MTWNPSTAAASPLPAGLAQAAQDDADCSQPRAEQARPSRLADTPGGEHLIRAIGELVSLQTEKVFDNKDPELPYIGLEHLASGQPRLIGAARAEESTSVNSVFRTDDILFAKLRPNLRKSVRAPFDGYCSTDILVLRCLPGMLPEYAGHLFQTDTVFRSAAATAAGTRMPRTSWADLKRTPVFVPETEEEQRRIAGFLSLVEQAIEEREAITKKLQQLRTGPLQDLLTRGIDENGELRDPDAKPEDFVHTPLGRLPKAWSLCRLGNRAKHITSGSRGWAAYYCNRGSLFLRIGDLTRENINLRLDDLVYVNPPKGSEGERTNVRSGDILISITADLGIIGVVPAGFPEAFVNQHIALVRPGESLVSRWVGRFLAAGPAAKQFQRLNDSGAKAGMNLSAVESLHVAVPSEAEQGEASRMLDELDTAIEEERLVAEKLLALKAGLSDDLITGRVRVPTDLGLP